MGPAAIDPISIAKTIPIMPDFLPIYFINVSLGIHISINPSSIIIGGKTDSIWRILDFTLLSTFKNKFKLNNPIIIRMLTENKKYLYLFNILINKFIKSP